VPLITPDVADSSMITKVELPELLRRHEAADGFFLQLIAAGSLDYAEASHIASAHLGIEDLLTWNIERSPVDPVDDAEAARLAEVVLRRRFDELHARGKPEEAVTLRLYTRRRPGYEAGWWASLDWCERFDERLASPGAWDDRLLPALRSVINGIAERAPGRRLDASGQCALAAAYALGAACPAPCGMRLRWRQERAGHASQWWSLGAPHEPSDAQISTQERDPSSQDVAVVVSVAQSAEEAVGASRDNLPRFRGVVRVTGVHGKPVNLATPGQALDLAQRLTEKVHEVRRDWRDVRRLHLFVAGPAGLAMLLGQLANGLGPVQTYEHIPCDAVGRYEPAALIRAS
jgi:hypothetical protein